MPSLTKHKSRNNRIRYPDKSTVSSAPADGLPPSGSRFNSRTSRGQSQCVVNPHMQTAAVECTVTSGG